MFSSAQNAEGFAATLDVVSFLRRGAWIKVGITHINTHTQLVHYSFDPAKQASNLKKHGLDFGDAKKVIESGKTVTFEDRRFDYGEERSLRATRQAVLVSGIVTAETEDYIRIISMRKADRHEQAIYRENLG